MPNEILFPINPFEDVKPSEFNKLNKKHVTEDFVEENFKAMKWNVFRPFNDTGIDRIIVKRICPNGHTALNDSLKNECPECKAKAVEIKRFVQVKTRQLKDNIFGFTLKSKDIRVDPRHIFLLYSDNSTDDKQDFLIIPVKDYLSFFIENEIKNPFAPTSFRKGNNKLNSLKYDPDKDSWSWNKFSWDKYCDIEGLKLIQNAQIETNLKSEINATRKLANKLQYSFSKGRSFSETVETSINKKLQENLELFKDGSKIVKLREKVKKHIKDNSDDATFKSMNKYFEFIKTLDSMGVEDDSPESKKILEELDLNE
jgi:hypothetical protein